MLGQEDAPQDPESKSSVHNPFPFPGFVLCLTCGLRDKLPRNPELLGWLIVRVVMGMIVIHGSVTFGPTLLQIAKETVGCASGTSGDCAHSGCNKKLWNFISASSYLSVALTISSLVMAFVSPPLGAWCDFTPHRKRVAFMSVLFAALLMLSGLVIQKSSAVLLYLFVAISFFQANYSVVTLTQLSYLTELTPHPDQNGPTVTIGYLWMFIAEIIAAAIMIFLSSALGLSNVAYARLSSVLFGTFSLLLVYPAWRLMLPRGPVREKPKGVGIVQFSFTRLWSLQKETREQFPDLSKLLLALLIFDPACNALVVLAATYLVDQLCLTATQVSIVLAISLLSSIPGLRFAGHYFPTPTKAKRALVVSLLVTALVTLLVPWVLTHKSMILPCAFGFAWGFLLAVVWVTGLLLLTQLTPGGSESEIAGLALFCYKALQWLPPFVFTILNEAASMRFGFWSLVIYFVLGSFVVFTIDVHKGVSVVEQTLKKRRSFWNLKKEQEIKSILSATVTLGDSTFTLTNDVSLHLVNNMCDVNGSGTCAMSPQQSGGLGKQRDKHHSGSKPQIPVVLKMQVQEQDHQPHHHSASGLLLEAAAAAAAEQDGNANEKNSRPAPTHSCKALS